MYQILIIDDEYESLQIIFNTYHRLKKSNFIISAYAPNGKSALKILETTQFDLIITDIRMPILDGLEFLKILRKEQNQTLVVLASTFSEFQYAVEGMRLNAFDYIEKPLTENKIMALIKKVEQQLVKQENQSKIAVFDFINQENIIKNSFEEKMLITIQETIQNNIGQPNLIELIAEELVISKKYLSKRFKEMTGITISNYITEKKLQYAKNLLQTSHLKIYEIGLLVGYQTTDYFTKKFKEYYGKTPNQVRKISEK